MDTESPPPNGVGICGAVSELRKNANDMMSSLNLDLPYPYAPMATAALSA